MASGSVPGWLAVSRIELANEEEAHRLQLLVQRILVAHPPSWLSVFRG